MIDRDTPHPLLKTLRLLLAAKEETDSDMPYRAVQAIETAIDDIIHAMIRSQAIDDGSEPTRTEAALWNVGRQVDALRLYRHRTNATLQHARAAFGK